MTLLAVDNSLPNIEWRKRCRGCGEYKPATSEFFGKAVGSGGLAARCKECKHATWKNWATQNREHVNAKAREARKNNPQRFKLKYQRRMANPTQSLSGAMRSAIRRAFTVKKLRSNKDARSWESLVGYTATELIAHIEKQFTRGMSWDNFGEWHVDHILPVSSFKFESVDDPEFRLCWALTNLRPMWGDGNRAKAAKRIYLL